MRARPANAQARRVVADMNSVTEDDPIVYDIIEELEVGIRAENEGGKATWLECFSKRNMLYKRTLNGMMLQFIQQLNGQNFYCTSRLLLANSNDGLTMQRLRLLR